MSTVQVKSINPVLAAYLKSLGERPLLTKSCTSAVLGFLQEITASKLANSPPAPLTPKQKTGVPPLDWIKLNQKAFKLAFYGFFVSAPLSHFLLGRLQKAFAGRTTPKDRILMILAQNLLLSPLQNTVYIASLAVIGGATSWAQIKNAIKLSFFRVMRLSWTIGPASMALAQGVLPLELWVPWFNIVLFFVGTFINMQVKKKALIAAAQAKAKKEAEESKDQ